jgi:hypothetical protein
MASFDIGRIVYLLGRRLGVGWEIGLGCSSRAAQKKLNIPRFLLHSTLDSQDHTLLWVVNK